MAGDIEELLRLYKAQIVGDEKRLGATSQEAVKV
jgi:hypothetical protein